MTSTAADEIDRLMRSVVKDDAGCWVWTGFTKKEGYGLMSFGGHPQHTHRVAYSLLVGPIPDGLTLDHLCRVRNCLNPAHLEPVTLAENVARSEAPTAANARKTHCLNGHQLSGENLYVPPRGGRQCRTCRAEQNRQVAQRRADAE